MARLAIGMWLGMTMSLYPGCGGGSGGDDDIGDTGVWVKIDPAPPCIDVDLGVTVDPDGRPLVACTLDGPVTTTRGGVATWTGAAWESEEIVTLDGWHADFCHIPLFDESSRLGLICSYWASVALTERDVATDRLAEVEWAPATEGSTDTADLQLIGMTKLGFVVWVRDDSGTLWYQFYGTGDYGGLWRWSPDAYSLPATDVGSFRIIEDTPVSFLAYQDLAAAGRLHLVTLADQDLGYLSAGPMDQLDVTLMPSVDRLWLAFRELDETGVPHLIQVRNGSQVFEQDLGIDQPVDELEVDVWATTLYFAYVDPGQGSSVQLKSCFSNPMCSAWDALPQGSPGAAHLLSMTIGNGYPAVIFVDETDPEQRPRVARVNDDNGWDDLAFPFATGGAEVTATEIAWDDDNQLLYAAAILQEADETRRIAVARFQGTSWQELEPLQTVPVTDALALTLTVEGIAAVGLVAAPQSGAAPRAALARVGTGRWVMKNELPNLEGVAVSAAGHTFWVGPDGLDGGSGSSIRVLRVEDDGTRTDFGAPDGTVPADAVVRSALGPGEVPFVLFEREDAAGGSDGRLTCVARWNGPAGTTATWTALGCFEPGLPAGIVVTSDGVPVVALYDADSNTRLWIFRRDGEEWTDLGFPANDLALPRGYVDLALTASDHPIVLYLEDVTPFDRALRSTIWRSGTEWGAPALLYGNATVANGEFIDAIRPTVTLGADQTLYSAFMYRRYWEGNTVYSPHVMRWAPN